MLRRITIDTNPGICNYKCIMCDTHSIYNKEDINKDVMEKEMLEKIIEQSIKINSLKEIIPSTMGEPLLYEHFDIFIKKLRDSNIKLNLTTNGSFPKYGLSVWADKLLPILSDIKISLNSIHSEVNEDIMINSDTEKIKQNIIKLINIKNQGNYKNVTVTLQITFMKKNLDEIESLIRFAIENKLDRVKGHQLWINWKEMEKEALFYNYEYIKQWNKLVKVIKEKYSNKIRLENFEEILIDNKGFQIEGDCPFLGNELWIDKNGKFNICCCPNEKRKTFGDFGNISDIELNKVFNQEEYMNFKNNYKNNKICKTCVLRR